jgi:hypothetical protein
VPPQVTLLIVLLGRGRLRALEYEAANSRWYAVIRCMPGKTEVQDIRFMVTVGQDHSGGTAKTILGKESYWLAVQAAGDRIRCQTIVQSGRRHVVLVPA